MRVSSLLVVFMLCVLMSCKEDDEAVNTRSIKGYLYKNCDKAPYTNKTYVFESVTYGNIINPGKRITYLGSTTTNRNGYFEFTYNECQEELHVTDENGLLAFTTFCASQQTNVWYNRPKSSHYLKILTDSSCSNLDTIYVSSSSGGNKALKKIIGPFRNEQMCFLDSIPVALNFEGYLSYREADTADAEIIWGLGKVDFDSNYVFGKPRIRNILPVTQKVCDIGDTAVIDLRGYKNR